jgi:hypothetical protein
MENAEAVTALYSLKSLYGELVDQRYSRGEMVDDVTLTHVTEQAADLFCIDGTWDGGPGLGRATGRAAIADVLSNSTLSFSRHLFVKPRIEVSGDQATGRWDVLCPCRRKDGSSWWMCGYEDDEYARIDGVWLHRSMTLTTVLMSPVADDWTNILV